MTMFILGYELGVGNVIMEALGWLKDKRIKDSYFNWGSQWLSTPQWVRQVGCQRQCMENGEGRLGSRDSGVRIDQGVVVMRVSLGV